MIASRILRAGLLVVAASLAACTRSVDAGHRQRHVTVWHAYRGEEQTALLEVLARARREMPDLEIDALSVPFDAYASKLEGAIPHGHGPDVFIDAHERLASYIARDLVAPLDGRLGADPMRAFESVALDALTRDGHLYGVPLAVKCVALYVNTDLVPESPSRMEQIEALRGTLPTGVYPLVYYAQNAYFHAPFAHAFGSGLVDVATGRYLFVGREAEQSIEYVMSLVREGVVPAEADGSLVSQLFASGRAATAISGPWLAADLGTRVRYRVVRLPRIAARDAPLVPFDTVEGAFVSSRAHDPDAALRVARFLGGTESAVIRARTGRQVVASLAAWNVLADDPFLATFRDAARNAVPMPTHPNMRASFEPANAAIRRAFRGDVPIPVALAESQRRFDDATRPLPIRRSPTLALLLIGTFALFLALAALRRARAPDFRRELVRSFTAYRWIAHAVVVFALLVFVPLVLGAATSVFAQHEGAFYYVGVANYVEILTARGGPLFATGSFYLVLLVTLAWTVANIVLHVAIGVGLALLLFQPMRSRISGIYRVVLIVPWAVPSYVTALAWKGMFHQQLGAINAIVTRLGGHPIAWFSRFATAFAANVATNVWLGFPFMMVVTLGALSSIPRDLYEAAAVDGATAWQRFWRITVPLLRPSLAPAVAMGAVWTFNMFNVIFLVSGGEPDGQTDILVTEAYRWAFTRQAQYGYAAAYAVLIFGILVIGTRAIERLVRRTTRGVAQ